MKKKLFFLLIAFVMVLGLLPAIKASAAVTYYETKSDKVPVKIWTSPSSDESTSDNIVKITDAGYVLKISRTVTNDQGNKWHEIYSGSYGGKNLSGCWVYDGNVKTHSHSYSGGICTAKGCGYEYPLNPTSFSGTFVVTKDDGAPIRKRPYDTETPVRTSAKGTVLTVKAKATNQKGNLWYQISDGNWVYSGNVTQRFTVKFDANGGSNPPPSMTCLNGNSITIPSTKPTRTGYIFKGWSLTSSTQVAVANAGGTLRITSNITLYAMWEKCSSHTYQDGICTKCKYEYPLSITSLNAYFMVTDSSGAPIRSRPYQGVSAVRTAAKGSVVTVNGYTNNQLGHRWYRLSDSNWVYSDNVTRCYKLVYEMNGGTPPSNYPVYYYVGMSTSFTNTNPTRAGYTFAGWYFDSAFTKSLSSVDTATLQQLSTGMNVSVYAKWTANTYSIAFNGNGASSGSMTAKTATYGKSLTLPTNTFKRTGYSFNGWNTKADGSGQSYANGASVSNLTATKGATVTLYAQWKLVKPTITTQPASISTKQGKAVSFKVVVSGAKLTYEWQYSADNGSTWKDTTLTGYNTATLQFTVTEARNGYQFRCIVKNNAGSVTTNSAKLTVTDAKPLILVQPKSVTTTNGKTVKFTVTAGGSNLTYQWQYSLDGSTWKNSTLTGCNTATLQFNASAGRNGYRFRCVVTNSYGSVNSSSARMTVSNVKPLILVQPKAVKIAAGKTVTFTVTAGGSGLKYQWQFSTNGSTWKDTELTGYNTATLKFPASAGRNGLYFRCVVTNSYGSVTTNSVKLTVG